MDDYLTDFVERSRGLRCPLEPRIPSLFEPFHQPAHGKIGLASSDGLSAEITAAPQADSTGEIFRRPESDSGVPDVPQGGNEDQGSTLSFSRDLEQLRSMNDEDRRGPEGRTAPAGSGAKTDPSSALHAIRSHDSGDTSPSPPEKKAPSPSRAQTNASHADGRPDSALSLRASPAGTPNQGRRYGKAAAPAERPAHKDEARTRSGSLPARHLHEHSRSHRSGEGNQSMLTPQPELSSSMGGVDGSPTSSLGGVVGLPASREGPAEPLVRVTIGRIEVRAAPAAVSRASPPKAKTMSLDEYLGRRKRIRR